MGVLDVFNYGSVVVDGSFESICGRSLGLAINKKTFD